MHIGDEMDINKEREAFEKLPMIREKLCWHIWFSGIDNKYDSYLDRVEEDRNFLNGAWMMFQAKATPEGFVLVPKELPEEIAEAMALDRVEKPVTETDPTWIQISEDAYKGQLQSKKWELWRDYKAMIEAQEQSHEH